MSASTQASDALNPPLFKTTYLVQNRDRSPANRFLVGQPSWRSQWRCSALSSNRTLYLVDQLDLQRNHFNLAIYTDAELASNNMFPDAKYVGTTMVNTSPSASGILGDGILNERKLRITALGNTTRFVVQDSSETLVMGRCSPLFELASPQERTDIRECLEFARSRALRNGWDSSVSEADRFACEQDSKQHIENMLEPADKSLL